MTRKRSTLGYRIARVLFVMGTLAACATAPGPGPDPFRGSSGPVTWQIVNIRRSTTPEDMRWHYTLLLRETTGIAMHFEKQVTTVEAPRLEPYRVEGPLSRELESRSELRLDTYLSILAGSRFYGPAGREGVTVLRQLHGKDVAGRSVTIQIRFPLSSSIGRPIRRVGPILPVGAEGAFDEYQSDPEYTHAKAFAVDMTSGAWGFGRGFSEAMGAVERALDECRKQGQSCEIYAIGDTIVWGMTREEIDAVVKRYVLAPETPRSVERPEASRRDASNTIQSKALKNVRWNPSGRTWRLLVDEVDSDGDAGFAVTHEPSHGAIFVQVMELYGDTTDASFAAALDGLLDARKKDARSFKLLDPFAAIALPAHTSCKFSEEMDNEGDAPAHYLRCVHVNDGWWSSIMVRLTPGRWEAHGQDINAVLERIQFPPKKHKSQLGFVATLPPAWRALSGDTAKANADLFAALFREAGATGPAADQLRAKIERGAIEIFFREPVEGGFADNIVVSRATARVLPETPAGWSQLCALVAHQPRAPTLRLVVCEERKPSGRPSLYVETSDRELAGVRMQYWIPRAKNEILLVTTTCKEKNCTAVRSELDGIIRSLSFVD